MCYKITELDRQLFHKYRVPTLQLPAQWEKNILKSRSLWYYPIQDNLAMPIFFFFFLQYTLSQTTVEQLKEPIFNIWHWEPNEVSCRMYSNQCKLILLTLVIKIRLNIAMNMSRIRLTLTKAVVKGANCFGTLPQNMLNAILCVLPPMLKPVLQVAEFWCFPQPVKRAK